MSDGPRSPEEVQEMVRAHGKLLPRGGGSKPALSSPAKGVRALELAGLSGVLEYDASEFTFTALAGTPVAEVARLLAENGQYLPFDPPLGEAGATLGGTVASGLSGPGRVRYGGVRDFILGVKVVTGTGELVKGGGKVVKNAAGFDLPKLMVGSLGRLGILVELCFKVFPAPKAYATLELRFGALAEALAALVRLSTAPFDLDGLELEPPGTLHIRIGGLEEALPPRLERLERFLGRTGERPDGESALWQSFREFTWLPEGMMLVKVPLTPKRILALDEALEREDALRRYSVAGNLLWLGWPRGTADLEHLLTSSELPGLVLRGQTERPLLGGAGSRAFLMRLKGALDSTERFMAL